MLCVACKFDASITLNNIKQICPQLCFIHHVLLLMSSYNAQILSNWETAKHKSKIRVQCLHFDSAVIR